MYKQKDCVYTRSFCLLIKQKRDIVILSIVFSPSFTGGHYGENELSLLKNATELIFFMKAPL